MPKVKFHKLSVVAISIVGEKDPTPTSLCPRYNDGGLLAKFQAFLKEQSIEPVFTRMRPFYMFRAGTYLGFFMPEDAEKIEKWLSEQDIEPGENFEFVFDL